MDLSGRRLSLFASLRRAQNSSSAYIQSFPELDAEVPAVWLDPEVMAIRESGGTVDLLQFLTPAQGKQLVCPMRLSIPPEGCPKPCRKLKASEENAVVDKLLESDLAAIVPEEVLPWVPFARRTYLPACLCTLATHY